MSKKIYLILLIIFGSSSAFCSANEQPDKQENKLNFKRAGTHYIPELHGTLTLSEDEIALFGNDIPKDIRESINDSLQGVIYFVEKKSISFYVFVSFGNMPFKISKSELKNDATALNSFKVGVEESMKAKVGTLNSSYSYRWLDAILNPEQCTFFSTLEFTLQGQVTLLSQAMKIGNKCCVAFWGYPTTDQNKIFIEKLQRLMENFKFDTEFECAENAVDDTFIGVFLLIFCGLAILLLFALIFAIKARQSARSGNKKLFAELSIALIITIVQSIFRMFNKPPKFHGSADFVGYILGNVVIGTLFIFFTFFFWTWNAQYAQSRPARNIISILTGLTLISFVSVLISLIIDCFKDKSSENVFIVCILLALLSFMLWKYNRIMRCNSGESNIDHESE